MSKTDPYLIPKELRPWWLWYPRGLVELIEAGDVKFHPWALMTADESLRESKALRAQISWHLIPFAYQDPSSEFACFQRFRPWRIVVVSDESSREEPMARYYPNFEAWLKAAKEESADWMEDERRYEERERLREGGEAEGKQD